MFGMVCSKQVNATDGFEVGIAGGTQTVYFARELATDTQPAEGGIAFDVYSHVVGTFDGASLRLYVNGVELDLAASQLSLPDQQAPLVAGSSFETSEFLAGAIDELAIYDKALSPARIMAHYLAGSDPSRDAEGMLSH